MVKWSVEHPHTVTLVTIVLTLGFAGLMPRVHVDTDPENSLSADDPARVFEREMKQRFAVHDMIVVGVANEQDPDGDFNPGTLRKIYALTEFSKRLVGKDLEPGAIDIDAILAEAGLEPGASAKPSEPAAPAAPAEEPGLPAMGMGEEPALPSMGALEEPALPAMGGPGAPTPVTAVPPPPAGAFAPAPQEGQAKGVVVIDMLAPSTVDRIYHEGGTVHFSYLMTQPLPTTREQALAVRDGALNNPLLKGTVVSADGRAVAIYLPITAKDISYKISQRLHELIARLGGPEQYHITGLPVAEDTFGHDMFVQMAVSAPLAMLVIFILMLVFFRKLVLVISPMIVALVSVIITMGLLIGLGYTVHIMSSMIPIFIMPIAVLDAIHILSESFDRYQATRDKKKTILAVMHELFMPMLYTSLTSAVGFASLALTPIPPVQVFGMFVAFGVMVAWVLTVTFIPAYIMFIPERMLANFGVSHAEEAPDTLLTRILHRLGRFSYNRAKVILTVALVVAIGAAYGMSRIKVNDNPTKWFIKSHPIRVADRVLNRHFAGTYQAYLALTPEPQELTVQDAAGAMANAARAMGKDYAAKHPGGPAAGIFEQAAGTIEKKAGGAQGMSGEEFVAAARMGLEQMRDAAPEGQQTDWDRLISTTVTQVEAVKDQPLKRPDLLRWIGKLQDYLVAHPAESAGQAIVGKSNSVTDITKKVYKELSGEAADYRVPDTAGGVAEALQQFQNSHTPNQLWHFVTPDFKQANVWLQLKTGDNRDMEAVVRQVDGFVASNPPPVAIAHNWFGLTYFNVVWQHKMVVGMLQSFAGSFLVVFALMIVLFHSVLWGLLSMIPLTLTIGLIYGLIGLGGKDYDMPVAVLSALTLGLAVDFAIHFLARSRVLMREHRSWEKVSQLMFGEPARAISRNAIVVAVGFLPLLAAPLVPYRTVGIFMASILSAAAVSTLLILPALAHVLQKRMFARENVVGITCNCAAGMVISVALIIVIAINLHQNLNTSFTTLSYILVVAIPLVILITGALGRRSACRRIRQEQAEDRSSQAADV
jgi:predicted RND superfamily exporter protein